MGLKSYSIHHLCNTWEDNVQDYLYHLGHFQFFFLSGHFVLIGLIPDFNTFTKNNYGNVNRLLTLSLVPSNNMSICIRLLKC